MKHPGEPEVLAIPVLNNQRMTLKKTTYLPILFVLLFALGCKTQRSAIVVDAAQEPPTEVSEADQLRSTAAMIDGSRQRVLGNWAQATVHYHDAATLDPLNDAAWFELARIHAAEGEYTDALGYIRRAVRLSPGNIHYQTTLADIYILSDSIPQAIGVYEKLFAQHPGNPEFAYTLATAYLYANRTEEALKMFQHIESLIGFSEEVAMAKQKIWLERREYDKAIKDAEMLVTMFPDEPFYLELLGELYLETGQRGAARGVYQGMLESDPNDTMALLRLADIYMEDGMEEEAFAMLIRAFRSPGMDAAGKARIIYQYYLMSESDPAYLEQGFALCRALIEMHPDDPESHLIYGDFLLREERLDEAREKYLRAAELAPANFSAWQQVMNIDGRLSDYESMLKHADKALEYFFEQPLVFLFHGLANLQLKQYAEAASSFEYGLQIAASNQDLKETFHTLLGDTYHYLGDNDRSDRAYEQAIRINPQNATALNNYAYHLAVRKERLDDAYEMAGLAIRAEPQNAAFLDTYGWVLYQMGKYKEALTWIEKAVAASDPPSAAVMEHLGDVHYKLGRRGEALDFWKKARELGEGSGLLDKKIRDKTLYE